MPYQRVPSQSGNTLVLEHCDDRHHPDNGKQVEVGVYVDDDGGPEPVYVPTVQIDAPAGQLVRVYVNGESHDFTAREL